MMKKSPILIVLLLLVSCNGSQQSKDAKSFLGSEVPISWSMWHATENLNWTYQEFVQFTGSGGNWVEAISKLRPTYKIALDSFSEGVYVGLDFVQIATPQDLQKILGSFENWTKSNDYGSWSQTDLPKIRQVSIWNSPKNWLGGGSKYYFIPFENFGLIIIQHPADSSKNPAFEEGINMFFEKFDGSGIAT